MVLKRYCLYSSAQTLPHRWALRFSPPVRGWLVMVRVPQLSAAPGEECLLEPRAVHTLHAFPGKDRLQSLRALAWLLLSDIARFDGS
jgi:hypothetical protein